MTSNETHGRAMIAPANGWSPSDIEVLARAVVQAPSVHNTQPWNLELPHHEAHLYERADVELPRHDPSSRDRAISCGTAIANLVLAIRVLGRSAEMTLLPDPRRPELAATIRSDRVQAPTSSELHKYSAIARRRSYRKPFAHANVNDYTVADLVAASPVVGVAIRPLRDGEELALASLLIHAAQALKFDRAYQRELSIWTNADGGGAGIGIARSALPGRTLPWAGLVRRETALPDAVTLADRIGQETTLLVITADDARIDHIRAGIATQHCWLTAVDEGLAGSVLTQMLHLPEVRAGLIERLGLSGYPQLLLRVGRPASEVAQSARRSLSDLLTPDTL